MQRPAWGVTRLKKGVSRHLAASQEPLKENFRKSLETNIRLLKVELMANSDVDGEGMRQEITSRTEQLGRLHVTMEKHTSAFGQIRGDTDKNTVF